MTTPQPKQSILGISPYVAGKSAAKGAQRIIKLSSNENPLGPSPKALEAYTSQASNLFRYPNSGHDGLRTAIAEVENLPADHIICGAGSDELIGMLIGAYTNAGDEVLYPAHGFLMYKIYALSHGAVPVTAPEKNLTTDVDALLAAVTPKTKIVFIANPNNPTGSYIPDSEVKRLREKLPAHVVLALDGAYAEYMEQPDYSDGRELVAQGDNTIVMHTFSKAYGLPALRVGWAYAPKAMIDILNRVRGPFNLSSAALAAAEAAIRDTEYTRKIITINRLERENLVKFLSKRFTVHPAYGNFILIGLGSSAKATALNQHLTENGIIIRDVVAYGLPECLRISIGSPEENEILMKVLESFSN